MFKLRRMHLDAIGSNSARFNNLTLDFTDAEANPLDTIIWLRNGGGKTSLLALYFSLLLPNRGDFLGARDDKKTLGDYVLSGDTAHILCEWDTPGGPLVTGAIYEWPERRRPTEHESHAGALIRRWYAFNPKPGALSLDHRPLRDAAGHRRGLDAYVRELRALGKAHPLSGLVVATSSAEWKRALLARGIDPAVFRYQKEMNRGEGAIDEQFRFASGEAFVSFLIDMAVDEEASESLAARIRQQADKLGRRPASETELAYCEGVAERLGPVAATWGDLERYREERAQATGTARRLAAELHGAHHEAARHEEDAESRRRNANVRRTAAETARTTARERGREFHRRAVEFWVCDAVARVESIKTTLSDVESEQAGWEALKTLFALEHIEGELSELDRRLSEVKAGAEPSRLSRNDAARRLHWRLAGQIDDTRRQREEFVVTEKEATARAERAASESQAATYDAGRHGEQAQARRAEIAALDEKVSAARNAGHLEPGEEVETGLARAILAAGTVAGALDRLEAELSTATLRQSVLVDERTAVGTEITRVGTKRKADADERDKLEAEAEVLSANERVRELAQSNHVSLWGAAPMLDVRLGEEIERTDDSLIAEGVGATRDRRNREALGEGGLLPAPEDTEAIRTVLAKAGVSATPGMAYLASSIQRREWDHAMSTHPGLLSGVLVDDGDFERARSAVIEAGLHPASLVTVAKKTDLQRAGEEAFVVPPSPALYDKERADEERAELDRRLAELEKRTSVLAARREADRGLRDQLRRFIESCPHGHLETLVRHIAEHDLALSSFHERRDALEAEAGALAEQLAAATATRSALAADQLIISERVGVLRPLATDMARRPALKEALSAAETDFADANERAAAAADEASGARREAERLRAEVLIADGRIAAISERLDRVDLRGEGSWGSADSDAGPPGIPTETLEEDLGAREEEYQGLVSDPVLEERRRRLGQDRVHSQGDLATRGEAARSRAGELRLLPEALDAESRTRRGRKLTARRDELLAARGKAAADREAAVSQQREVTPSDRRVYRELAPEDEPIDRVDAERRRADAEAEAQRQQASVSDAEREIAEASGQRDAAKTRKDLLEVLARALEPIMPVADDERETETGFVAPFKGSDDEARAIHDAVFSALRAAIARFDEAERKLTGLVMALRQFVGRNEFESAGALREAVGSGEIDDVARRADELAEQHRVRAEVLRHDLQAIAADQEILVTDLSGQVRRVLDLLKKAPSTSKMDRSLGEWGGKSFLTIGFDDVTAHPDELARRVSAEVDVIVAKGLIPDGLATLKKAVLAAVPGGFKVRVLKPTPDLREERVSVSAMAKWSGGEKLTAAVVLYCIIARLRARNRASNLLADSSGALVLDNPLGKSSYVGFLAMQRRVAEALGVQLLYTTAVRDLKAVGTFPNVIRCRNYTPAGSDRGYVAAVERAGEALGTPIDRLVAAARVVRIDPRTIESPEHDEEGGREEGDVVA
jgi:hypothetical protein